MKPHGTKPKATSVLCQAEASQQVVERRSTRLLAVLGRRLMDRNIKYRDGSQGLKIGSFFTKAVQVVSNPFLPVIPSC